VANNKKPKKKYSPRRVIQNTLDWVITGIKPPDRGKQVRLQLMNHGSMFELNHGTATTEDWQNIANMLNIACVMAESGICELPKDAGYIKKAQQAHASCGKRKMSAGSFGYTGDELLAVNTAFAVHDWQIRNATVSQFERALLEVNRQIAAGNIEFRVKEAA
jgi:hypothetical protein